MTRSRVFCKHYRSMSDHQTCAVGIAYETFKGLPFDKRPCFAQFLSEIKKVKSNDGCHLAEFPTPEEIAAEDQRWAELFAKSALVGHVIIKMHGPWKRGMPGVKGVIDCPVCGAEKALSYSRAGYNGHLHARCATDGCVSFMQ